MIRMVSNNRGFAVAYALVVLLVAAVVGTGLLFMAQKDRANVSDFSKVRETSQAAQAALKACEGQFFSGPGRRGGFYRHALQADKNFAAVRCAGYHFWPSASIPEAPTFHESAAGSRDGKALSLAHPAGRG